MLYITLCTDFSNNETTTEPLFYSEGVLSAKRDLKKYASTLVSGKTVLSFKYSLDEFKDATVARFSDDNNHSFEVIKIETIPAGFFTSETREVTIMKKVYIVHVTDYKTASAPKTPPPSEPIYILKGRSDRSTILHTGPGLSPAFDSLMEELVETVEKRNAKREAEDEDSDGDYEDWE